MLQLEARRAGPVVLGEEPDFCSGRPSEGRLQVGKPVTLGASRRKGVLREGGLFPPRFSADSANSSEGMGFKTASATASAAKPSDHPGVGHTSPPRRLRRCQTPNPEPLCSPCRFRPSHSSGCLPCTCTVLQARHRPSGVHPSHQIPDHILEVSGNRGVTNLLFQASQAELSGSFHDWCLPIAQQIR